ncbi:MAG: four helix bundle protein [Chloroflexota bacterium]
MNIEKFTDLEVWQLSRELSKLIGDISSDGKFNKDFRFRDQIRASSGSIMDNIAEGFERGGNTEFIQFLYIAKGSSGETRSQLFRAFDYGYIDSDTFESLVARAESISLKLGRFINYLKNSNFKGAKSH